MKKTMISLLCLISCLVSVAFAFYERTQDTKELSNIELATENAVQFYVKDSDLDLQDELSEFERLSKEYQATFIRTDTMYEGDREIVYKSGVFSDQYFKEQTFDLIKGTVPKNKNEFLATFETGKAGQSGTIRDLFNDNQLILGSLNGFYAEKTASVNGVYTLIVSEDKQAAVLADLSSFFGIEQKVLLTPTMGRDHREGTIFLLALVLMVIIFAIFCLMNMFYPIAHLKEIGVMKLLGYRNVTIWNRLNNRVLLVPLGFYLLSISIQKLLIKGSNLQYFAKLSLLQFGVLGVCLAFSLLMLILIHRFKISDLLKNHFSFRFSLYFSYILKFLVFVGMIFTIPMMADELNRLTGELRVQHVYEQEQNYLTLANINYVDDELQSYLSGENILGSKITDFYKELEQTADAQYIVTERTQSDQYKFYNVMQVNENYLKTLDFDFPISSKAAFSSEKLTYFAPESLKVDLAETESFIADNAEGILEGSDDNKALAEMPVQILYYPDNQQQIFSQNLDLVEYNDAFVQNPIIVCLSDHFFTEANSRLQNSALYNPIRILDTEKNRNAIKQAIVNHKLEQNEVKFGSVLSTGFSQALTISQTSLLAWIGILILAILVSILASYYIVLIILRSKNKYMLVSRLLGYSLFERYRTEIFYFCAIYCFGLVEILLLSPKPLAIASYLMLVVIDSVVIYFMVRKHEKRSLSLSLKGEE